MKNGHNGKLAKLTLIKTQPTPLTPKSSQRTLQPVNSDIFNENRLRKIDVIKWQLRIDFCRRVFGAII